MAVLSGERSRRSCKIAPSTREPESPASTQSSRILGRINSVMLGGADLVLLTNKFLPISHPGPTFHV